MVDVSDTIHFDFVSRSLQQYSENPSAFLALNSGNEYFTDPSIDGFIAYRGAGHYMIEFGGVFAAEGNQRALLARFLDFASAKRRTVVAIQLQRADAELFAECGFTVNQVGASYSLHLPEFTLSGPRFMKLRNKISRAKRSGLEVSEVALAVHAEEIVEIDRTWLRNKGPHVKEIDFLVGQCGGPAQGQRRLFLGRLNDRPVAYISYSPAYGSRAGWLHDLSRRAPDVVPGVMEAINLHAMGAFQREGAEWLHFGFTPFAGLSADHELAAASRVTRRFMGLLADHGSAVYPASSQLAYKQKWGPQVILPEYIAFHGRASFGAIWQILRVTKSI